jgi:hypothetical protein
VGDLILQDVPDVRPILKIVGSSADPATTTLAATASACTTLHTGTPVQVLEIFGLRCHLRQENAITILNKNRINAILKVFKRIFHVCLRIHIMPKVHIDFQTLISVYSYSDM